MSSDGPRRGGGSGWQLATAVSVRTLRHHLLDANAIRSHTCSNVRGRARYFPAPPPQNPHLIVATVAEIEIPLLRIDGEANGERGPVAQGSRSTNRRAGPPRRVTRVNFMT